ncbi:MAG: hypothetical protein M1370_07540 [Bacteroidetes bacterium]|nr:hypothetical protein [Bacteroidota bacterium]
MPERIDLLEPGEIDLLVRRRGYCSARLIAWAEMTRLRALLLDMLLDGQLAVAGWDDSDPILSIPGYPCRGPQPSAQ